MTVLNEEVTLNDKRTYRAVDMIYADKLHEIYYIRPEGDSLFCIRFMNVIEGDADDSAALDLVLNGIKECIK